MADVVADAARKAFADLTAELEDAAMIAAHGQGVKDLGEARRHWRRLTAAVDRVERRLRRLESHIR